jgi:adenine-specific DNA-methyltransferase
MTTPNKYETLSKERLIQLLLRRDAERKLGLVWEQEALEPELAINNDFVALNFDAALSAGIGPYQNLLVEGDNFDVLRYLNIAFRGQIRCIYIDPPYNTGNKDFLYNDSFLDKEHRYRHSTWLEFMYRRLSIARDLLTDDGVIFISIGEDEHARLEMLCDEVFPRMKVANFVWRTRSGANDEKNWFVSVDHEYVLCYANPGFSFAGNRKALADYSNPDDDERGNWASKDLSSPKNIRQRPNTYYPLYHESIDVWYACDPDRVWAYAKDQGGGAKQKLRSATMAELIREHRIDWKVEVQPARYDTEDELSRAIQDGTAPQNLRIYKSLDTLKADVEAGRVPSRVLEVIPPLSFWVDKNIGYTKPRLKRFATDLRRSEKPVSTWVLPAAVARADAEALEGRDEVNTIITGYTSEGTTLVKQMLSHNNFPFPKPLSLIKTLIAQATDPQGGDIILDFFAGTGTTGHAVLAMNAEDDGDRRFILVSSTEATKQNPDQNLCRDVTARRLQAALQGYQVDTKRGTLRYEGVSGDFAYLRAQRIPLEDLHRVIQHDQVWLTLQQMHGYGVTPYQQGCRVQFLEAEAGRIAYLPQVTEEALQDLQVSLGKSPLPAAIYSPTPALLESRMFNDHYTFLQVPDVILERFGVRL